MLQESFFSIFKKGDGCIYWPCWVCAAVGLPSSGGRAYASLCCLGFSLQPLPVLRSLGSRAQAQWLWPAGLGAPRHVGSSRIRDGTRDWQEDSLPLSHH